MVVSISDQSLKGALTAFGQLTGPMAEKGHLGFLQTLVKNDRLHVKDHLQNIVLNGVVFERN